MHISFGGVLLAALLASSPAPAITSGEADATDPAVVGIVDATGLLTCTGAVVAPHVVLTAAHCTRPTLQGATVVFGASAATPTASVAVTKAIAHPSFDPATLADDVAILVLASAAPTTPLATARAAPAASFVGSQVAIVGYGETSGGAGDTGTKRRGTALVSNLGPETFDVVPDPSQPCEGDSGGPAIAQAAGVDIVVGVTSHGDGACAQQAVYARVDAYADFLSQAMASVAPGTAPPGARCLYPEVCAGGARECLSALDDPDVRYCSRPCASASDCPGSMACAASQCRYRLPTPGALGSACSTDDDCVDGRCVGAVCTLRCDPVAMSPCPDGFQCVDVGGIDYSCVAAAQFEPAASGSGCALAPTPITGSGPALAGAALGLALTLANRQRALRRITKKRSISVPRW